MPERAWETPWEAPWGEPGERWTPPEKPVETPREWESYPDTREPEQPWWEAPGQEREEDRRATPDDER